MEFGYSGEPSRGIQKTPDPAFYEFELASRSTTDLPGTPQDFSLHISFTDYPGEYIRENQIFVRDKINEASAVLIAIDTPALMEEPYLNERMNATNYFSALLQSVFSASRTPRLVLLTPIKCERWVQSLDGTRDLTERIRSGPYKDLLDNLAGMTTTAMDGLNARPYVAVAITPIQTVGSMVFAHFEKDEFGRPVHVWKKIVGRCPVRAGRLRPAAALPDGLPHQAAPGASPVARASLRGRRAARLPAAMSPAWCKACCGGRGARRASRRSCRPSARLGALLGELVRADGRFLQRQ